MKKDPIKTHLFLKPGTCYRPLFLGLKKTLQNKAQTPIKTRVIVWGLRGAYLKYPPHFLE